MKPQKLSELLHQLDSLMFGEAAVEGLIAHGPSAVPPVAEFLLHSEARTISLPRCRAARVLGALGARETLMAYLREYPPPQDPQTLFSEDAVRSAVAMELLQWKVEDVYQILWAAVRQRSTIGLVDALGQFCRNESIPLLADVLEDDLCREQAKAALEQTPEATRKFLLQFFSERRESLATPGCRKSQATMLEILVDLGVDSHQFPQLMSFLQSGKPSFVIPAAKLARHSKTDGIAIAIVDALLNLRTNINWLQEIEIIDILEQYRDVTASRVKVLADQRFCTGIHSDWLSPSWRIFHRFLVPYPNTSHEKRH